MDFVKWLPFHVKFLLLFHTISAKFDYFDVGLRPLQDAGFNQIIHDYWFAKNGI